MTDQANAHLRAEVDAVMADWAWFLDHGDHARVAELFTEDAELVAGGGVAKGRSGILARYASRTGTRSTRHTYSGLRVTLADDGTITATSTWVCWAANLQTPADDLGAYLVADFHDRLVRDAGGRLLISDRRIVPVFRDPSRAPVVT